ncbi:MULTISPECIES: DUF2336 domain-containing protein [Thalassospira]|uniref:DUF2336 domain-containing protein n=2 Tax=Thalassospira TaxID=168934 RepID=A0A367W8H2_9PROT|nr:MULTISPECIES: DUF2336 domain-containing protein [Thalassospira]MDG4721086.1 DUF2336 domain-containing protein [Thalassospira sp. FZY0004]RCK36740.1 hypothetical protein TH19_12530 [Thalassospira profundimaris]
MKGFLQRVFTKRRETPITYDEAKEMAASPDANVRGVLAQRHDTRPEILYYLASDNDSSVRRHIAANEATPVQADVLLTDDVDDSVRGSLAEKIAHLSAGLTANETDKLRRMTYDALDKLARDQAVHVRQVISETLKDIADAPQPIIQQLARDTESVVCGPVLQYSPVLTEDDLLEIIEGTSGRGTLSFVSRRRNVGEKLADAIAASSDKDAISHLLGNKSAQIREETLDQLIDRAPDYPEWHQPLVDRPTLPPTAAGKLARFVAENLISVLERRKDLKKDQLDAVREVVQRRISSGEFEKREDAAQNAPSLKNAKADKAQPAAKGGATAAEPAEGDEEEPAFEKALALHAKKKLTDKEVAKALAANDVKFARAALAVLAGISPEAVTKVLNTHSAKGVVSLAWKAGLPADLAVKIQVKLGHVPPSQTLNPRGGNQYPLSEDDMNWQLEFFTGMATTGLR